MRNVFFSLPVGQVVRIRFFYHRGLGLIPAQGITCFWGNTRHKSKTWHNCRKSYTLLSQRPKDCCNLENSLLLYQHSYQRSTSEDFFSQGKIFFCQAHVMVHCCQKVGVSHKKKVQSFEPDLNQQPKDYSNFPYSPPLYQLSYRRSCRCPGTRSQMDTTAQWKRA